MIAQPISKEEMGRVKVVTLALMKRIRRKGIDDLMDFMSESNFFTSPASTMYHGNFPGGLAKHSLEVYAMFTKRLDDCRITIPEDSRVIGAICHDFCKIDTYIENRLKSGNLSDTKPYKVEDDFPVGHGEKSVMVVQRYVQLSCQEMAMIRWHMGNDDPAWEDYKERVEQQYPEAILLQDADREVSKLKGY